MCGYKIMIAGTYNEDADLAYLSFSSLDQLPLDSTSTNASLSPQLNRTSARMTTSVHVNNCADSQIVESMEKLLNLDPTTATAAEIDSLVNHSTRPSGYQLDPSINVFAKP